MPNTRTNIADVVRPILVHLGSLHRRAIGREACPGLVIEEAEHHLILVGAQRPP